MVKRYYCDFCDCAYPYSTEAFRKHRTGHHHIKKRKAHYDQFKSTKERLDEEVVKGKCRRFMSGQECPFGDSCVFSHLTPAATQELKEKVAEEEEEDRRRRTLPTAVKEGREVSVEGWLKQTRVPLTDADSTSSTPPSTNPTHTLAPLTAPLPPALLAMPSLPPSLTPLSSDSFWLLDMEFAQWG